MTLSTEAEKMVELLCTPQVEMCISLVVRKSFSGFETYNKETLNKRSDGGLGRNAFLKRVHEWQWKCDGPYMQEGMLRTRPKFVKDFFESFKGKDVITLHQELLKLVSSLIKDCAKEFGKNTLIEMKNWFKLVGEEELFPEAEQMMKIFKNYECDHNSEHTELMFFDHRAMYLYTSQLVYLECTRPEYIHGKLFVDDCSSDEDEEEGNNKSYTHDLIGAKGKDDGDYSSSASSSGIDDVARNITGAASKEDDEQNAHSVKDVDPDSLYKLPEIINRNIAQWKRTSALIINKYFTPQEGLGLEKKKNVDVVLVGSMINVQASDDFLDNDILHIHKYHLHLCKGAYSKSDDKMFKGGIDGTELHNIKVYGRITDGLMYQARVINECIEKIKNNEKQRVCYRKKTSNSRSSKRRGHVDPIGFEDESHLMIESFLPKIMYIGQKRQRSI